MYEAKPDDAAIGRIGEWLASARRVVFFTGAGISTDSGIPDFRGPNGLWTKNPLAEKTSTLSYYLRDPEVRKLAWEGRARNFDRQMKPNDGHRAIVDVQSMGILSSVITQNVDGLHQAAGIPDEMVIEVHGTGRYGRCWECGDRRPMDEYVTRVIAGDPDPHCEICGGVVKSDAILFEQSLVPEVINRAFEEASSCDLLVAVGSTLQVSPANGVVPEARANGARVVIVNGEPTVMDGYAHEVIIGSITPALRAMVASGRSHSAG